MTLAQQSQVYLNQIQNRKRSPVRLTTLSIYQSYINKWIVPELGSYELISVDNGAAKKFVTKLSNAKLAPTTITGILSVMKDIIKSAQDENGNYLHPRQWNADFIDAPEVNSASLYTPVIGREAIQSAVRDEIGQFKALYTLLAATGLRVAESFALMAGPDDNKSSFWLPEQSKLIIRTQWNGRNITAPKTASGIREVDIHPEINAYLKQASLPNEGFLFRNGAGAPIRYNTALEHLNKSGISEGFHAFRRFRITHLEAQSVPPGLQRFWTGHAAGDVHESYIKIGQDLETRRDWASKAGFGFELPKQEA